MAIMHIDKFSFEKYYAFIQQLFSHKMMTLIDLTYI